MCFNAKCCMLCFAHDSSKGFDADEEEESLICHVSFMPFIDVYPEGFWGRFATTGMGWFPSVGCEHLSPESHRTVLQHQQISRGFCSFCIWLLFLFSSPKEEKSKTKCNQLTINTLLQVGQGCLSAERFSKDILPLCSIFQQNQHLETGGKTNKHKQALQAVCWRHK